jgi:uncharacterized delta-60 repeat protein
MRRLLLVAGTVGALAASAAPSAAAPGNLDDTFGTGGVLVTAVGDGGEAIGNGIALAPGGGLLVAAGVVNGGAGQLSLVRTDANATPASLTLATAPGDSGGIAVLPQGDRPLVAGYGNGPGSQTFVVSRFLPTGGLDADFGGAGTGLFDAAVGSGALAEARALALQGATILAAGTAVDAGLDKVAIFRLRQDDGTLDPAFTTPLFLAVDAGDAAAAAVAPQGETKFLVAGYALDGGVTKFMLARRLGNGDADPDFANAQGIVLTAIGDGREAIANALLVQPDGKLVLAGSARDGDVSKLAVARFSPEGALDPGFGSGGVTLLPAGDGEDTAATAVALQPDGKLVLAGRASASGGGNLVLARLNADGTPDGGFGTGGVALTPLGDDLAEANGLVLQGEEAVVTGYATQGDELRLALARYRLAADAPGTSRDVVAPVLSHVGLTNKVFRVGHGKGVFAAARRRRHKVGTTINYRLSEAARATLTIQRKVRGVSVRGRCLKPSRRRHGRRCTRIVGVGKPLVRESPAGTTSIRWNGRVGRKALKPGAYRLAIVALDAAGNRSETKLVGFTVVRG